MKKTLSMLLAFSMLLGLLTTTAMAAGETTYTIIAPDNDHTYEVYQIFVGDLSQTTLSNVKWGQNGTGTAGEAVAEDILTRIAGTTGTDTEKLAVITEYVKLTTEAYAFVGEKVGENNTRVASVAVPAGYYLIKDVDNSLSGENDAYTLFLVKVVGDVTITPKANVPTFQKKVDDKNDSNTTEDATDWQDSADYDIGDDVPFQLKGTVAENYADYATYKFVFHDKQSSGLTFNADSVQVYVDDVEISTDFTVVTENLTDGCTFEVQFANLKGISAVKAGSVITVEYTATLNNQAVIGSAGNPNVAYLEYSNNPNASGAGDTNNTGKTPEDKVIVFTYQTVINKVDEKNEALTGAEFKLEKKLANDTWETITVVKNDAGTEFTFKGLDDGQYRLTETVTPAGYNTIEPIYFEIAAEHDAEAAEPTLISLTATHKGETFAELESGKVAFEFGENKENGTISGTVVNQAGSILPETGGIGTTIFYVLGGLMAVGAGVLLVAKKRMDA